jgi:purine-cytosine permease-like protein
MASYIASVLAANFRVALAVICFVGGTLGLGMEGSFDSALRVVIFVGLVCAFAGVLGRRFGLMDDCA